MSYEMEPDVWKKIIDYWDRLDRAGRHRVSLDLERKIAERLTPERTATVTLLRATEAKDLVDQYTAGEIPWLLIDIPGNRPGADVGLFSVQEGQRRKMRKDDRVVGDLQESRVWNDYAQNLRQTAGKIRVFCQPSLVDTIEASIPWETGIEALEEVLAQAVA